MNGIPPLGFQELGQRRWQMGVIGQAGGGAVPRVLVYDSFTDTNGVLLQNHTADTFPVGSAWAKITGTAGVVDIQSNKASWVSGSAHFTMETGKSDVTLSAILTTNNVASNPGIMFRNENTAQLNFFFAYLSDSGNSVNIIQYINGTSSLPYTAAQAVVTNTPYAMEVVLLSSSIKVYIDGVLKLDVIDTDHQTATKHGISMLGAAGVIDDFQVIG